MTFYLLVFSFLLLLFFPFILSIKAPHKGKENLIKIRQDDKRVPRSYALEFNEKVETMLSERANTDKPPSEVAEPYIIAESISSPTADKLVISESNFYAAKHSNFQKEVYAAGKAFFDLGCTIVACSAAKVQLADECYVSYWIDGEKELVAGENCNLGICATSKHYISMGNNNSFKRIFSPLIEISVVDKAKQPLSMDVTTPSQDYVDDELRNIKHVAARKVIEGNIVTKKALYLREGCTLKGHISSSNRILIKRGCQIYGNIFSDKAILIEGDCFIGGIVFSQGAILVGPNSSIGQAGKIKSVIAREELILSENSVIYGYVNSDKDGLTTSALKFARLFQKYEKAIKLSIEPIYKA